MVRDGRRYAGRGCASAGEEAGGVALNGWSGPGAVPPRSRH